MKNIPQLLVILAVISVVAFTGCSGTGSGTAPKKVEQVTFETPQALVAALKSAAAANDTDALLGIFGPDGYKLVFSGDTVLDQAEIRTLSNRLNERADLVPYVSPEFSKVSVMKLRIGRMANNTGIPLVSDGKGWRLASRYFAPRSVKRRIASNEIAVWRACQEYYEAQNQYFSSDWDGDGVREYAQKFISSPGKRDGLYWKQGAGEKQSPLGEVIAQANAMGYHKDDVNAPPVPFHGYIFRILTRQGKDAQDGARDYMVDGNMTGGFAMVAYPIGWGSSGLRTFIVGPKGIIFGKNLGYSTETVASEMKEFNTDRTWLWVQQPQVNEFEEYLETL